MINWYVSMTFIVISIYLNGCLRCLKSTHKMEFNVPRSICCLNQTDIRTSFSFIIEESLFIHFHLTFQEFQISLILF